MLIKKSWPRSYRYNDGAKKPIIPWNEMPTALIALFLLVVGTMGYVDIMYFQIVDPFVR